jgi:hypothetical protein
MMARGDTGAEVAAPREAVLAGGLNEPAVRSRCVAGFGVVELHVDRDAE